MYEKVFKDNLFKFNRNRKNNILVVLKGLEFSSPRLTYLFSDFNLEDINSNLENEFIDNETINSIKKLSFYDTKSGSVNLDTSDDMYEFLMTVLKETDIRELFRIVEMEMKR